MSVVDQALAAEPARLPADITDLDAVERWYRHPDVCHYEITRDVVIGLVTRCRKDAEYIGKLEVELRSQLVAPSEMEYEEGGIRYGNGFICNHCAQCGSTATDIEHDANCSYARAIALLASSQGGA